jgi:rRNA-processing protein EBP2
MGKKIKRQPKSFLQKEHEEDEEKEEEAILREKSKKIKSKQNQNEENNNIINAQENEEEKNQEYFSDEEESIESINLVDELTEKLNSIKSDVQKFYENKGKKITWLEFPVETSTTEVPEYLNPDDDIKRELIFYNIAKENAIKGMIELKKLGEKLNRPDDYFVEMLKSDEQMMKVKKQIINEQQYIKRFEAKKQKMQNIKFAKTMKDHQNKERSKFKRQTMEGVENWKKHIKENPDDYKNIDKFFVNKKKKFNPKDLVGKRVKHKSREKRMANERYYKKKQMKRPGKVKRMMMRNKKNSKKIENEKKNNTL